MGKLEKGLMGAVTGKIGNLVYYVRNGENVVRRKGRVLKPASIGQLRVRMEMKVTVAFLKPVLEFMTYGFELEARGTTKNAYNLAVRYNKMNALMGVYPEIEVDYAKVLLTDGNMDMAQNTEVEVQESGFCFTWQCIDMVWPRENDQVMLMAYFPSIKRAVYLLAGAKRKTGKQVLAIPADMAGLTAELYISFVSEDRKRMAKSLYAGQETA